MKQSILLSSLLGLLLVGSSFIYFSSSSLPESLEETTSFTVDIDYPKTINVGEEFRPTRKILGAFEMKLVEDKSDAQLSLF